ncbi:MAG TPA: carboxypeptidase-like regulatory domain-containing protein [Planctomycetota bacterium]|nr:carboxypeptidase-like regulatory domain-containing protein [Planctomycetota bacterium]
MRRFVSLLAAVVVLVVAMLWWLDRRDPAPTAGTTPPEVESAAVGQPAVAATAGALARDADASARSDASPERGEPDCVVRGFVLADPRSPDLTAMRVLAYRGEPEDTGGVLPGAMAGAERRGRSPAFVLTGEPLAESAVAANGAFGLHTKSRHVRLTLDHDLYLQPLPEVVHVPRDTNTADLVLAPMLGGCLRGRLLGERAADVERVRLVLEPDPMSVLRDSRALMSAMLAGTRPPAVPRADRSFLFRGVTPDARLALTVEGGRASARCQEPALQPGEVRDVVLPVATGAELLVRVVDEHDAPVAGAFVSVRPDAASGLSLALQTRRETTGADGTCLLRNLDAGGYVVDATASGLAATGTKVQLAPTPEPAELRLVLAEGGVVTGTVLAPDGAPVEGARVAHQPSESLPLIGDMATQIGPSMLEATTRGGVPTDAEGRFRLSGLADDGTFLVVAAHPDYSVGTTADVRMGDTGVTVTLQPLGGLRGRVVAEATAAPVAEFTVCLLRTSFLVLQLPVRRSVVHDADGAFRIEGVSPDSYTLQVEADGYSTLEKNVAVPAAGSLEVGTLSLSRAARVHGIVRSEQGRPIRGALVQKRRGAMADNPMLAMFESGAVRATTDAEGRFELAPLAPGGLQLLATAADFASGRSERIELVAGQDLDGVVIELGHGGTIRGRLVLGPAQRVEDFLLLAQHQVTQNSQSAESHADGTFVIENLDPGTYTVQAMPQRLLQELGGGDWKPGQGIKLGEMMRKMTDNVVSQRCTVRSGETQEATLDVRDVAVGARWFVEVEVGGEPQPSGLVEATSLDSGTVRVAMLQDGVATFGRVQPGRHRLQVRAGISMTPVGAPQDLDYPSGVEQHRSTLRLPGGELRGRVVDAGTGEPLPNAIVRLMHDDHSERDDPVGMCLSNADGEFVFTGLADGTYSLVAAEPLLSGAGSASSRCAGIRVLAGTTNERVELRSRPSASASVLVTGADGEALAGATVLCVDDQGRPLGSLGLAATGADGRAWFGGMANGPARVVGRAVGHAPGASMVLQLAPDRTTAFSLQLARGAPARLCVVDANGEKLRGATLAARCDRGPWLPAMLLVEQVGADGTFDLGRLGPGAWQFRITHPALGTVVVERDIQGTGPVTIVVGGS